MKGRSKPLPFQILDGNDEFHFLLKDSIFISVTSIHSEKKSVGAYLPVNEILSLRFSKLCTELQKSIGAEFQDTIWKVLGTPEGVSDVSPLILKRKILRIEKRERSFSGELEVLYLPSSNRIRIANNSDTQVHSLSESKTRVLIVDDSQTIRTLLSKILSSDTSIEVVGLADKPSTALKMIETLKPDVITLDVHMPEMDGVSFLKSYIQKFPIPTIMITSISFEEGPTVLTALESGAVDYLQKPSFDQLKDVAPSIIEKIKTAKNARVEFHAKSTSGSHPFINAPLSFNTNKPPIIAIGSSTGGTEALRQIFQKLPSEIPPILIVQHIPPVFSKAFADRMNSLFPFEVLEGLNGLEVKNNRIIIAPGATQMTLKRAGERFTVCIDPNAPPMNRHKPSVDVLFNSVAKTVGSTAVGVILTGMGADGSKGLLEMKKQGAFTLGQDEATSIVYGMPRAAMEIGAVDRQLPLAEIVEGIRFALSHKKKAA